MSSAQLISVLRNLNYFLKTKTGKNQVEQLNQKFATNLIAWEKYIIPDYSTNIEF